MLKNRLFTLQDSFGDKVFVSIVFIFLIVFFLIVAYPLLYIVSSSFSDPKAVIAGKVWLFPVDFSLKGYEAIFDYRSIWIGYKNSVIYTVVGTVLSVSLTVLLAYPLSRKDFFGRHILMVLILITMFISGGLIPLYLVVRDLGILDTWWAMIIPNAMGIWQVIICRTFFQMSIPSELIEAGELDGCGDTSFFLRIVIPLSKPVIAVMALMYAVGTWNAYFDALIYLKSSHLYPLQIILRNILVLSDMQAQTFVNITDLYERASLKELIKYSLIVVASLPVLILYPFLQKYFVKGVLIGSLKG